MSDRSSRTPAELAALIGPEAFARREAAANAERQQLEQVLVRYRAGGSRSAAIRSVAPGVPVQSTLRRLRQYERGGVAGLIDCRVAPDPTKVTVEATEALRVLALADPELGAARLAERLAATRTATVKGTTIRVKLRELGLARPTGRPRGSRSAPKTARVPEGSETTVIEDLPEAGVELLKAVDLELGAVAALTAAIERHMETLPAPLACLVKGDAENRDDRGRFLPDYNRPEERTHAELGERFDTVAFRRERKDLRTMRAVSESDTTHFRKLLALVLLPVLVRGGNWSALDHWRGEHLASIVGFPYQASTLDKFLRELKFAGAAAACQDGLAEFWIRAEGPVVDGETGVVALYIDGAVKPVWTHHWTKCARVSRTGRVMPAITTLTLHSGGGTPLIYRSYSGVASLTQEAAKLLSTYEKHAGEQTVRRITIMDREAHSVALFRALDPKWTYIIPLRNSVTSNPANFSDLGGWTPYTQGDEVQEGILGLNERGRKEPYRVRVVGRKRARTGKVAWYATNAPAAEINASAVIRLYFERWPAQEHVYRDASGKIGIETRHGHGKAKVDNVAILDQIERLKGRITRWTDEATTLEAKLAEVRPKIADWKVAAAHFSAALKEQGEQLDALVRATVVSGPEFAATYTAFRDLQRWLTESQGADSRLEKVAADLENALADRLAMARAALTEAATFERRRQIFTVDVELDQMMTAFKFTFLNLCRVLMRRYLGWTMEVETLVEAVLCLPGQRLTTGTTELVRIYRSSRDAELMDAVGRACVALSARGLVRGDRTLRFELTDPPPSRRSIRSAE